jgi:peptidoglycan/LPS O-acetylase OafA/YrhL
MSCTRSREFAPRWPWRVAIVALTLAGVTASAQDQEAIPEPDVIFIGTVTAIPALPEGTGILVFTATATRTPITTVAIHELNQGSEHRARGA